MLDTRIDRLYECEFSARFWADEIGRYAEDMRKRARGFAIGSAVLSALSAGSVWAMLAASTHPVALITVGLVSFVSALISATPPIFGWSKCAETAASLAPKYGHLIGELRDAGDKSAANRDRVIEEFEAVKALKDSLSPFPAELARKRARLWEKEKARILNLPASGATANVPQIGKS